MQLINSDCISAMREMPDNSVDSIVTDPPYELGFMGKSWDSTGIAFNVEVWQEALRVLKPGGHLLAFSGSRTYHRMAVAIEDAGFQIRDQIMWIYGSGFPKSLNLKDEWQGWGTALKPAHEPLVLARKPLIGTVADNVLAYGTGGLNIDGSRVGSEGGTKLASEDVEASQSTKTVTAYGNGLDGPFGKLVENLGRWPANVIHDGSNEVVELFPTSTSKKSMRGVGLTGSNVYGSGDLDFDTMRGHNDSGSAARFFYCAKASKRDRNEGLEEFETKRSSSYGYDKGLGNAGEGMFKDRNPIKANHHPTVKPTALMQYLIKLVTPPNGIVLDPFMGSGSTGKACAYEGFDFIGIDMAPEYVEIAKARIAFVEQSEHLLKPL